jgi:SDR family mycofactocin-dependent oxidoreductase
MPTLIVRQPSSFKESHMGRVDGKVVFITGAARGQGRSHAQAFAEEGADLMLVDICSDVDGVRYGLGTEQQLEETARRCREHGSRVVTMRCDVRDQSQLDTAVARAIAELGQIDVLINNAGVGSPAGPVWELSEAQWSLLLDIDLNGVWRASKAVIPHMIERKQGCILSTSSSAGLKGFGWDANYVAAKHGVVGLTKNMAIDLAQYGIRVNCICPGSVRDDPHLDGAMLKGVAEEFGVSLDTYEQEFASYHLFPVLMEARDISRAYVWLASEDCVRVTGAILALDAGFTTK